MWPFDQNNHHIYQQYAQAYDTGNYYGIDPYQTWGHLGQFMQSAPMDMQQQIYQQHFAQMPYEQRAVFAQQMPPQYYADPNDPYGLSQSLLRLGQEQPHLLQQIFSHPLLLGAGLGLAGLVAKHVLSHHHQTNQYGQPYGYAPGYGDPRYMQQEVNELRREEQELRREIREEEREEHHHHHRRDFF